jgi:hypothetical protein
MECVVAWILEPSLTSAAALAAALPAKERSLKGLQNLLVARKKDRVFHEAVAWEILETPQCVTRLCEFIRDLSLIASAGIVPPGTWSSKEVTTGTTVFTAGHIRRA